MSVYVATGAGMAAYGFRRGSAPDGSHWFRPDRFARFWEMAAARGLDRRVYTFDNLPASDEDIGRFHELAWWHGVRQRCEAGVGALDHGPTPAEPGAAVAAAHVVGAALEGCRLLLDGRARRVFVPIAGFHHGKPAAVSNYCLLNDAAVALRWLRAHGVARPAYVDIDVHFGDGVFEHLGEDVACADLHQHGGTFWYGSEPEVGTFTRGARASVALPPGTDDAAFLDAFAPLEAWIAHTRPDFIVFQCGADGLAGDALGSFQLSEAVHRRVTTRLCAVADRYAGGRLLALGGGGYHAGNLARAWCAVVESLLAAEPL